MSQPNLLELEAPIKICGGWHVRHGQLAARHWVCLCRLMMEAALDADIGWR